MIGYDAVNNNVLFDTLFPNNNVLKKAMKFHNNILYFPVLENTNQEELESKILMYEVSVD